MAEMIKVEDTWGGGRYVSSTVLKKAQAGSPTAIGALSSVGYSVKDGKIVRVSTGEVVKDIPKEFLKQEEKKEELRVAEAKAQSPKEVSVYDIKSLAKPPVSSISPIDQFEKSVEGKVWNPFSQEWITVPKTEEKTPKQEPAKIYTTTAPSVKTFQVPETLKTIGTATVKTLPSDVVKMIESKKEKERQSQVFEKVSKSYPLEYKTEEKVTPNIYRIEDYKTSLLSLGVDEKELEKRMEEARSKGNELWINPTTLETFERPVNRIEVSSPFEAYAIASKYGIKDYQLMKVSEGIYDFSTKDFDLSKIKVPEYKIYALEKDFADFIAPEFLKEKSLKELVKEEGLKGLSKKIVKDSSIYELKEGYYILEKDGQRFLLAIPESEKEFKKLEDILDKKFNEYLKSEMRKYQIERMVERGKPYEKALIYTSTVGTSPVWSLGKYVFQGEKGVKEFAKEKAYSFASAKSPLEAGLKGAFETETGLFSTTFLGSSILATTSGYAKGLSAYTQAMSDFYGKYRWVSKGISITSTLGKPVLGAAKVAVPVYAGVSMAPTLYYSARTGDWEPTLWSVKQMGVGAAGFLVGSRYPLRSSVEFAQRMEMFKSTHSPESFVKPLEDKYLIGTRIRFGEEFGKGKSKEMGVFELDLGHTYVTRTGKVITELPKVGVAPEQSIKLTVYPMSAGEYFRNVIWNKKFGVPERYVELRSPSLIEGYRKTFLKPIQETRFKYDVTFASKEGRPVLSETSKTDVGVSRFGDFSAIKEKYYSMYQYKNIDEILSKKVFPGKLRGDVYVEPIGESKYVFKLKIPFEKGEIYKLVVSDDYKALASRYFSELKSKYPEFVSKSFKSEGMKIPRTSVQSIPSRTGFREIRYYYTEDESFEKALKPFRSDLPSRNVIKELSDYYKIKTEKPISEKTAGKLETTKISGSRISRMRKVQVPEQEVLRIVPKAILREELRPSLVTYQGASLGIGLSLAVSSLIGRVEAEKLEFKPLSMQKIESYPSLRLEAAPSVRIEPVPQPIELTPVETQKIAQEQKLELVQRLEQVPRGRALVREIYRFEGAPSFLPPMFLGRRQERKEPKEKEIEEVRIVEPLVQLKKVASTAYPDFYSALVSQAVYGKATAPRFTPEQLERLREKGYIRVPTKEYRGLEDPNKVLKKIIGG